MKQMTLARLAVAMGTALLAVSAASQTYPTGPVRVVVGFPPGSSADVAARVVSNQLAQILGTSVVVENRPGAGSNIATEAVARAPGDGYTLLMGTVANTINQSLHPDLKFNFASDFAPIALVGTVPNLLVVHPSVEAKSVADLIALAKAKPGTLTFASSGNGTSPHLSGELFGEMAGVKLVHVPYKGSSQAVVDLVAGRVSLMFSPASTVLPHIKSGKLRALASTGLAKANAMPELPTLSESGLGGFDTGVWFGLLAPAKTPPAVIERLARATAQARDSAELKSQFASQGIDLLQGGPKEFGDYIGQEIAKWAKVIKAAGVKLD
jgi:tripartite-type tricarboxylate transporter receptor subunit TctC